MAQTLMALNAKTKTKANNQEYSTEDIETQQKANCVLGKPGSSMRKGIIMPVHLCNPLDP